MAKYILTLATLMFGITAGAQTLQTDCNAKCNFELQILRSHKAHQQRVFSGVSSEQQGQGAGVADENED